MVGVSSGVTALRARLRRATHLLRRGNGPAFEKYSTATPLPPGAADELVPDNPRLVDLKRRYAALDSPITRHTLWSDEYRAFDLDLAYFRGDNAYVWQQRWMRDLSLRLSLYVYLRYLEEFDSRGLLTSLGEDGAFGCFTYDFEGHPRVSRDLLDSVNELYFLDRTFGLFSRSAVTVLDIGAGYGRLAHRMTAAAPNVVRYFCVDAIPESTFLSEYYLGFRGCTDRATVVPLDEMQATLPVGEIDLAVNIHSFSEMSLDSIDAWMTEVGRLRIRELLVVPNDASGLFSMEPDRSRRPAEGRILAAGFERVAFEPIFRDPNLPELLGVHDKFMYFRKPG